MDQDRNKIFDTLDRLLEQVGEQEPVDVLIMVQGREHLDQLEEILGKGAVKYRYSVVPAVAARVTREQVHAVARQTFVRHIEHDAEVTIMMDGASHWFGAAHARADFGVTGSLDGSPGYSAEDVVVAVIDTGIDAGHVDLDGGKVIAWKDWVNDRSEPYDDHGHGTHVAGIIAGTGEGNPAYTGVAPGAALIGLKVLNRSGSGTLSNVTAAVDWAVANKDRYNIRVISMSRLGLTKIGRKHRWQWHIRCSRDPAQGTGHQPHQATDRSPTRGLSSMHGPDPERVRPFPALAAIRPPVIHFVLYRTFVSERGEEGTDARRGGGAAR